MAIVARPVPADDRDDPHPASVGRMNQSLQDPMCPDPDLTEEGRMQCLRLRERLSREEIPEDALWIVSPLSRCIQTMLLGCPRIPLPEALHHAFPEELQQAQQQQQQQQLEAHLIKMEQRRGPRISLDPAPGLRALKPPLLATGAQLH